MHASLARLTMAALVLHSLPAAAEQIDLDLRGALDRARRAAPDAVAARGRTAEAEAGVVGADVAFTSNPEIDGGLGPRLTPGRPVDAEVRIAQDLEPWRRGPRRRLARAEVARARAEAEARLRDLDREVSLAFYEAVFADQMAEQMRRSEDVAQRAAEAAHRRRQAGQITDLEENLARVALGRARSETELAAAGRTAAIGRLAILVGAAPGDTLTLRGVLEAPAVPAAASAVAANRADVRVLDREREVARAEHARAVASGRPELGLFVGYSREDTDGIVLGGLRVTLPVWNRAQGDQAAARAHERRAAEARDQAVRAAEREVADAWAVYAATERAVEAFERDVLPLLDDSEQLLQNTIDAGQIAISEYLVARQEVLSGRREHLERRLALAKAAIAVRYVTGGAP